MGLSGAGCGGGTVVRGFTGRALTCGSARCIARDFTGGGRGMAKWGGDPGSVGAGTWNSLGGLGTAVAGEAAVGLGWGSAGSRGGGWGEVDPGLSGGSTWRAVGSAEAAATDGEEDGSVRVGAF